MEIIELISSNLSQFAQINSTYMHIKRTHSTVNESSRSEVFCKKGVLKDFAKFTGKNLCQRLFFNKVAGLLKKRL